jgi:AcrR family transcriptional regulator
MARRSEHSQEEIKQMVLEAAEDIVREYGYSALKVRKIAADIGYTVGSIYMVFANMNDLNMHIKARTWQKMTLYLDSRADQPVSLASVNDFASNYLDFSVSNEGLWRMLFEHQLPLGAAVPAWYLHDSYSVVELFYQLLKQLNMQYSDEHIRQAAETLIQGMQGICMQLIMQGASSKNTEVGRKNMALLVDYFMRGWSSEVKK